MRTTFAGSALLKALDTLQTLESPSLVWTASMSDFCRDEDACQLSETIGEGPLEVVRLCKIVNLGCRVATSREPFWYLHHS